MTSSFKDLAKKQYKISGAFGGRTQQSKISGEPRGSLGIPPMFKKIREEFQFRFSPGRAEEEKAQEEYDPECWIANGTRTGNAAASVLAPRAITRLGPPAFPQELVPLQRITWRRR